MEKQPVLNVNLNRGQESLGLIPRFKLAINYCFCIQRMISSVHLEGREKNRAEFSFSKVFFLFFVCGIIFGITACMKIYFPCQASSKLWKWRFKFIIRLDFLQGELFESPGITKHQQEQTTPLWKKIARHTREINKFFMLASEKMVQLLLLLGTSTTNSIWT